MDVPLAECGACGLLNRISESQKVPIELTGFDQDEYVCDACVDKYVSEANPTRLAAASEALLLGREWVV